MTQLVQLEGKHTDCTKSILCIVLMSSTLLYPSRCWFSQIRESHLKITFKTKPTWKVLHWSFCPHFLWKSIFAYMEKCGIKLGLKGSASNTTTYRAFPLRRGQGVPTNSAIFFCKKKIVKGTRGTPPFRWKRSAKEQVFLVQKLYSLPFFI